MPTNKSRLVFLKQVSTKFDDAELVGHVFGYFCRISGQQHYPDIHLLQGFDRWPRARPQFVSNQDGAEMTASTSNENFRTSHFVVFLRKGSLQFLQDTTLTDYDRLVVHHLQSTPANEVLEGFLVAHREPYLLGVTRN